MGALSGHHSCPYTRPVTRGAKPPLENFGHNLEILDIVQKIWAPLGKLFAPPGGLNWLRACLTHKGSYCFVTNKTTSLQIFLESRQIY